jgi:hypothetical protein
MARMNPGSLPKSVSKIIIERQASKLSIQHEKTPLITQSSGAYLTY